MGNQAELGPDMTRLKVLRCACGSPMPVLMPRAPLTHYLLIHDPAHGDRGCAFYRVLNF